MKNLARKCNKANTTWLICHTGILSVIIHQRNDSSKQRCTATFITIGINVVRTVDMWYSFGYCCAWCGQGCKSTYWLMLLQTITLNLTLSRINNLNLTLNLALTMNDILTSTVDMQFDMKGLISHSTHYWSFWRQYFTGQIKPTNSVKAVILLCGLDWAVFYVPSNTV